MRHPDQTIANLSLLLAALTVSAASPAPIGQPAGSGLAVTITGIHSRNGDLVACLWRDKRGFPSCEKSRTARKIVVPVTGTEMLVNFPEVSPSRYAITVHHDEDANGRMKHNLIGMPVEGVGVSNNPGGMPGYEKSLLEVGKGTAVTVRMRYLFG